MIAFAATRLGVCAVGSTILAYDWCMLRANIDACAAVMRRYQLTTKREAVDLALQSLAAEAFRLEEARRMRGPGWGGDLDEVRGRGDGPR